MSAPFPLPNLMAIFRPNDAVVPIYTDVPCRIVPVRFGQRLPISSGEIRYDHWVDVESSVDIRDACTRSGGFNWNNAEAGDKVATVFGGVYMCWLVFWVEVRYADTAREWKRAYLVRECVNWAPS